VFGSSEIGTVGRKTCPSKVASTLVTILASSTASTEKTNPTYTTTSARLRPLDDQTIAARVCRRGTTLWSDSLLPPTRVAPGKVDRDHGDLIVVAAIHGGEWEAADQREPQSLEDLLNAKQEIVTQSVSSSLVPNSGFGKIGLRLGVDDDGRIHPAVPLSRARTSSHGVPAFGSSR